MGGNALRSPVGRVSAGMVMVGTGLVTALGSAGTAGAQAVAAQAAASTPFDSVGTPVGLSAVGLGVLGMVAGVLRRKKVPVHPENQREMP
jgi:hypothetical protein